MGSTERQAGRVQTGSKLQRREVISFLGVFLDVHVSSVVSVYMCVRVCLFMHE